jgi:type I restriction enzyme R subunit
VRSWNTVTVRGEHEGNIERPRRLPPAYLWARYRAWKGLTREAERIVLQDYFDDGSGKALRIIR